MGLPSKAVTVSKICLKGKNGILFNATKNCFKQQNNLSIFFYVLHKTSKLPPLPNNFTEFEVLS